MTTVLSGPHPEQPPTDDDEPAAPHRGAMAHGMSELAALVPDAWRRSRPLSTGPTTWPSPAWRSPASSRCACRSRCCSRASRASARPRRPGRSRRCSTAPCSGCSATRGSPLPTRCTNGTTRQLLTIRRAEASGQDVTDADLFDDRHLLRRPVLRAVEHPGPRPAVLLIDEVDRADDEFEAFLLELLADAAISILQVGTVRAAVPPVVVLTSNRTRDLHDALKRRCLYHWIDYPAPERALAIVRRRVPRARPRWSCRRSRPCSGSATSTCRSHPASPRRSTGSPPSRCWASSGSTRRRSAPRWAARASTEDVEAVRSIGLANLGGPGQGHGRARASGAGRRARPRPRARRAPGRAGPHRALRAGAAARPAVRSSPAAQRGAGDPVQQPGRGRPARSRAHRCPRRPHRLPGRRRHRGDPTAPPVPAPARTTTRHPEGPRDRRTRSRRRAPDADLSDASTNGPRELALPAASSAERLSTTSFAELSDDETAALAALVRTLPLTPPLRRRRRTVTRLVDGAWTCA